MRHTSRLGRAPENRRCLRSLPAVVGRDNRHSLLCRSNGAATLAAYLLPYGAVTRALLVILSFCAQARAVELHLQFGALERMIADAVFTQDGRRYVHNDRSNKCNFAYLEKPQIQGADGRLRIRARFTGRSALNVIGQCVGLGDAFTVVMLATPQYRNGNIVLQNVTATSEGKTGIYIRRVCGLLGASLERDFKYPLASEAKRILEDASAQPGYQRELRDFQVPSIRVADDALVIQTDFALIVK